MALLLKYGSDVTILNGEGHKARDIAYGEDIIKMLIGELSWISCVIVVYLVTFRLFSLWLCCNKPFMFDLFNIAI